MELENDYESDIDNDDESDIENDDAFNIIKSQIYEGSQVSVDEAVFIIMEHFIEHKITKVTLQNMLKICSKLLPQNNLLPRSNFKLFQWLGTLAPVISEIKHYYCKNCLYYYGGKDLCNLECKICSSTSY